LGESELLVKVKCFYMKNLFTSLGFDGLIENRLLFGLGMANLILFGLLCLYYPFNDKVVLGLNSVVKPIKFALSIWIYAWTMAVLMHYLKDVRAVYLYSWVAVICMVFEQLAVVSQALRGVKSHFNRDDPYGMVLYGLMGIFILTLTLWTAWIAYLFIRQSTFDLPTPIVLGIQIGLVYFVVFSLFGGYIAGLTGHTVGAADGGEGLWFLNWSRGHGDLRVAHFFGMHSLQVLPLFAVVACRVWEGDLTFAHSLVWVFSVMYLGFILHTMYMGLKGLAFIQ
jgi:hypothetical protein